MKRALLSSLLILFLVLYGGVCFWAGCFYVLENTQLTTEVRYLPSDEKTIFVDVVRQVFIEVVVEKEIEVIKWRNIADREFKGVAQFKEWYYAQDFKLLFPSGAYEVDCDDYALRLQRTALRQGYLVSSQLTQNNEHMLNMVVIGNEIFYIEPQPNKFKVWKVGERD